LGSVMLVALTSAGWTGALGIFPGSAIFYIGLFVAMAIISLVLHMLGAREVILAKGALIYIAIVQVATLVLNYGDCGDAPGGSAFVFRLFMSQKDICRTGSPFASSTWSLISLSLFALLALSYVVILGLSFWDARPKTTTSTVTLGSIYAVLFVAITTLVSLFASAVGWNSVI
jgi:hypothetical protein